jgi:hypothetical protein
MSACRQESGMTLEQQDLSRVYMSRPPFCLPSPAHHFSPALRAYARAHACPLVRSHARVRACTHACTHVSHANRTGSAPTCSSSTQPILICKTRTRKTATTAPTCKGNPCLKVSLKLPGMLLLLMLEAGRPTLTRQFLGICVVNVIRGTPLYPSLPAPARHPLACSFCLWPSSSNTHTRCLGIREQCGQQVRGQQEARVAEQLGRGLDR